MKIKNKSIITVKEWFFDKVNSEARSHRVYLVGESEEINGISMLDHTKLRVEEFLNETEKAVRVSLDAETESGKVTTWTLWIPKSVIIQ